ncbi:MULTISPECIES: hypothetical protein [Streptomyces rochei group]|uniref:hypothetical protein n=1 Tax=Streptomyces rochei group TaxID=2867164 RepID=UPI001875F3A1|nr:hypothetical protein [Streptomyces vinaceusdrappus]GHC37577.1 hypothetical protein GCM10010308_65260 [Streptomyces vinaceusdrappus]
MDTLQKFRTDHGDYTTWTDEVFDLYFALIADQATHLTQQITTEPADLTTAA